MAQDVPASVVHRDAHTRTCQAFTPSERCHAIIRSPSPFGIRLVRWIAAEGVTDRRTNMRRDLFLLLLMLSTAGVAEAQARRRLFLGAGISFHDYSDSRFGSTDLDIVPMYRFSKGEGEKGWDWDMKTSIGFSRINVPSELAEADVRLGKLRTIRLLFGVARSYRNGPMKVGAYVTSGPSFNHFEIDDGARTAYEAAGSSLDAVQPKTSFAFKPGVSASYAVSSWLALRASVSYTINRPKVRMRIDGASTLETWKLDRSSAALGVVLGLF
jgi:hypothetical protein